MSQNAASPLSRRVAKLHFQASRRATNFLAMLLALTIVGTTLGAENVGSVYPPAPV